MMGDPLNTIMDNGASVADWLGTAGVHATTSAWYTHRLRTKALAGLDVESELRRAADNAAEALSEVCAVMDQLGYLHGYSDGFDVGGGT